MNLHKLYVSLIFIFLAHYHHCIGQKSTPNRILIIGDSYLYISNVDSILSSLCIENGKKVEIHMTSFPGFSINSHLDVEEINLNDPRKDTIYESNPTLLLLSKYNWDQIIIQSDGQPRPNEIQSEIFDPLRKIRKLTDKKTNLLLVIPEADPIYPIYKCGYNNMASRLDCFIYNNQEERIDTLNNIYNSRKNDLEYKYILMDKIITIINKNLNIEIYLDEDGHPNSTLAYIIAYTLYAEIFNDYDFSTNLTRRKYSLNQLNKRNKIDSVLKTIYYNE